MVKIEELEKIIDTFKVNFQGSGFIACDNQAHIKFVGTVLLNYEGLRLLRFQHTQMIKQDLKTKAFEQLCKNGLTETLDSQKLFKALRQQFHGSTLCVIISGKHIVSGYLAVFKLKQLAAYLF